MHNKPLTKIQQRWLEHVNQATEQNLSMSAYAKQNDLSLKAFYNARSSLMQSKRLTNHTYFLKFHGNRLSISGAAWHNSSRQAQI